MVEIVAASTEEQWYSPRYPCPWTASRAFLLNERLAL